MPAEGAGGSSTRPAGAAARHRSPHCGGRCARSACRGSPVERIGAWTSIDRTEIESMRSVQAIIHEYLSRPVAAAPCRWRSFGPPGAGKSFAIKQMAREWAGNARISVLEFNLSQFSSPNDLPAALQRVRDQAVEGTLPSSSGTSSTRALGGREFGRLAQFLAPMQDGAFLEGGIVRPIGPASSSLPAAHTPPWRASRRAPSTRLARRPPTFSVLCAAIVDILGPNAPNAADDATFQLRRRCSARATGQQAASCALDADIDPGCLARLPGRADLCRGALDGGHRRHEYLGELRYERSALPPRHRSACMSTPTRFWRWWSYALWSERCAHGDKELTGRASSWSCHVCARAGRHEQLSRSIDRRCHLFGRHKRVRDVHGLALGPAYREDWRIQVLAESL